MKIVVMKTKKKSPDIRNFLNNRFYHNHLHKEIENKYWIIKDFVVFCFYYEQTNENMLKLFRNLFSFTDPKKLKIIIPYNFSIEKLVDLR